MNWTIDEIGALPGHLQCRAYACSSDGSTVVGYSTSGSVERPFRWTSAGIVDLGSFGGNYGGFAFGCSADGSVVVGTSQTSGSVSRSFRWTAADGLVDIEAGRAYACSADGSVVVGRNATGAYRWTQGGGSVSINTLGATSSAALGCSADGSIVVGYWEDGTTGGRRAFKWTQATGMVDLGRVAGESNGIARACSDDGTVVVGYSAPDYPEEEYSAKGFVWTQSGGFVDLTIGAPAGITPRSALACSADGSVVYGAASYLKEGLARVRSFRWTAAGGVEDLGVFGSTYGNARIYGCSSDGNIVAGAKVNATYDNAFRAVLDVPPPPPPPLPPNNGATIEFEPLVSSPETVAEGAAQLARIMAYGQEGVGAYSINVLPRLVAAGTGSTTEALTGDGVAALPALATFGSNATVGLITQYTGDSFSMLPPLTAYAMDASELVPQAGWGSADLPALFGDAVGGDNKWGTSEIYLPPLQGFSSDAEGAYGVAVLPELGALGAELPLAPDNRMLLVQSPGIMAIMASNDYIVRRSETVGLSALPQGTSVKTLAENIRMSGNPFGRGQFGALAIDGLRFDDALTVVWRVLLEEQMSLVGSVAGQPMKFAHLVDALVASGTVSCHMDAREVLAAALAINSMVATGWHATASDSVAMNDALRAHLTAVTSVLDSIAVGDTGSPSMRLTALVNDSLVLDDDAAASMQYMERLGEDVLFFGAIRLGSDEYVGWVLNEGAASEYRNYPFNGFAAFDGKYYGTAADGLYLLEGDDDQGVPIEASIKTALMDFGTGVLKRIPDVYVAFVGSDKLVLKVITPGQRGEQVETIYTSTVPEGAALHNGRIRIGQGLKSRYWQFELTNVDGADFEIDELAWRPMTLDRRI